MHMYAYVCICMHVGLVIQACYVAVHAKWQRIQAWLYMLHDCACRRDCAGYIAVHAAWLCMQTARVCTCMRVYAFVCIICIYVYMCVYMCIHVYTCVYMCMPKYA
jgi:hypothetical protein